MVTSMLSLRFSTRPAQGGYGVLTWDLSGGLISKADFTKDHVWQQTSYFGRQGDIMDGGRPQVVLSPLEEKGISMLEFDPVSRKYNSYRLFAYPAALGSPENSLVNSYAGEPRVCGATSEGDFYFCTAEELQMRREAAQKLENGELSLQPEWKPEWKPEEPEKPEEKPALDPAAIEAPPVSEGVALYNS